MNILVIGNGFDLAHGLPTKYYDFIKFVELIQNIEGKDEKERNHIVKNYQVQFKINENITKKLLDNKIYENIYFNKLVECVQKNGWIEYFKGKVENQSTWVDFEGDIKQLIKIFDVIRGTAEDNLEIEDGEVLKLRDIMKKFLEEDRSVYSYTHLKLSQLKEVISDKFIKALEEHLKKVIRAFEIYLALFIEDIDCSVLKGKIDNIDAVISFNYSNTFEKLYGKDNIKYDYIHGKANLECDINKNNMVLGIDEYLNDDMKDKDLNFIFFKKYFQRIYKRTGCTYKAWLEEIVEYSIVSNIYFYGHSLSRADKDILRNLILCKSTRIIIFYHNDEAYRSQITNLVDVIGQDNLIEKVYGSNPTIIFESTEDKENIEIIGEDNSESNFIKVI